MGDLANLLAQLPADYEVVIKSKTGTVTYKDRAGDLLKDDGKVIRLEDFELVGEIKLPGADSPFLDWPDFWRRDHGDDDWLVEDVFAYGRGHVIYASAGSKKSLFTLAAVTQLITSDWPVAVIYLDYEMTETDLKERLEDMGYGPTTDLSRLHYALLPSLPPLDTKHGADAIEELLNHVEAAHPDHHIMVVIDTTGRALQGEENSADTLRDFYRHTGITLKRRGTTWTRLDHTGKDVTKGQRGTKAKDDDPDIVWWMRETANGIQLDAKKRRMGWVQEQVAFVQRDDPLRFIAVEYDPPKGTQETAERLDKLSVPTDATVNQAQRALREDGEGIRRQVVSAAQKWRREHRTHLELIPGTAPEPPKSSSMGTVMGTVSKPPIKQGGTDPGTAGNRIPRQDGNHPVPSMGTGGTEPDDFDDETNRIAP